MHLVDSRIPGKQGVRLKNHLKTLVARVEVVIYQHMVKQARISSFFELILSISKSLLDLFLRLSPPDYIKGTKLVTRGKGEIRKL